MNLPQSKRSGALATEVRRRLWHLRAGGLKGLRENVRRRDADRGIFLDRADGALGFWTGRGSKRQLAFNAYERTDKLPRFPNLRVAVILDDFSLSAFECEWTQIVLRRGDWKEQLVDSKPHVLFAESAWAGNQGEWSYQLTGAQGPSALLLEVLEFCSQNGIPSVFWNKEDPPHYSDFLDTARVFDYVFTSDSDRIPSYRKDLGHNRVAVMQFAAQPFFHNPARPRYGWHERDVAFAGMYFAHKYPERKAQMHMLLDGAIEAGADMQHGLEIFSRHAAKDPNYEFPEPYKKHVVGSLSYERMLTAYKAYKAFLNVNSVVDSPTMCARRIFEITASGTTVISTPSRALSKMWEPDEQFIVSQDSQASDILAAINTNPELSMRQVHRAQRRIWENHTYSHRVRDIVSAVLPEMANEFDLHLALPPVSLLVSTIRPHQLEHVLRTVGSFRNVDLELVLSTHGFSPNRSFVKRCREEYGIENLVLLEQPADRTLGDCLNACVDASSGAILSKMDDDDLYSSNYLRDLLNALRYSDADIVGKQAHYMYILEHDVTLLRFPEREHRFTNLVMGPTITGRREVFIENPFAGVNRGEDSLFLKTVTENGGTIYSADKYNYAQFRGSVNHAWPVSDLSLLKSAKIAFFGGPEHHVEV